MVDGNFLRRNDSLHLLFTDGGGRNSGRFAGLICGCLGQLLKRLRLRPGNPEHFDGLRLLRLDLLLLVSSFQRLLMFYVKVADDAVDLSVQKTLMRAGHAFLMLPAVDVLDVVALGKLDPADRAVTVLLAGLRHLKFALNLA